MLQLALVHDPNGEGRRRLASNGVEKLGAQSTLKGRGNVHRRRYENVEIIEEKNASAVRLVVAEKRLRDYHYEKTKHEEPSRCPQPSPSAPSSTLCTRKEFRATSRFAA